MQVADGHEETVSPGERYLVGEIIGRGGLGDVYRAEDTQLCRLVAMKRLHGIEGGAEENAAHILQEARNLAALQHPNIVTIYDVIANRGDVVVVMELLQGKTLQEIAEQAPLVAEDFVDVMEQTLQGLIAAHSRGMLHRDIKPSNLMLSRLPSGESQLKILDFGMAKVAPGPSEQTKDEAGALMGSIYMMSPEQLQGRPLDARSDLYSLGCVAYFALTACYPFAGKTVVEVITAHLQGRCTPLEQLRPDLPKALCDWVNSLMSVQPDGRPGNAASALAQLRGVLDPVPPVPVVVSMASPIASKHAEPVHARKLRLPHIRIADVGVGLLLIAICALSYFWLVKKEAKVAAIPLIPPTEYQALLARLGEPVVVEGVIKEVSVGKGGGFRYLRFVGVDEKGLTLAFFSTENPQQQIRRLWEYVGKKVRVTGTVSEKNGVPQIFIDSFSQLETL
jgi:hypothetical protein